MKAGRKPMRLGTIDQMRAWAAATGLMLAGWFFGGLFAGDPPSEIVAMLVTAIGGFEFALYATDLWRGRKTRHG